MPLKLVFCVIASCSIVIANLQGFDQSMLENLLKEKGIQLKKFGHKYSALSPMIGQWGPKIEVGKIHVSPAFKAPELPGFESLNEQVPDMKNFGISQMQHLGDNFAGFPQPAPKHNNFGGKFSAFNFPPAHNSLIAIPPPPPPPPPPSPECPSTLYQTNTQNAPYQTNTPNIQYQTNVPCNQFSLNPPDFNKNPIQLPTDIQSYNPHGFPLESKPSLTSFVNELTMKSMPQDLRTAAQAVLSSKFDVDAYMQSLNKKQPGRQQITEQQKNIQEDPTMESIRKHLSSEQFQNAQNNPFSTEPCTSKKETTFLGSYPSKNERFQDFGIPCQNGQPTALDQQTLQQFNFPNYNLSNK